ncbi:MAG: trigger factor [Bacteroidetes bacterium]|nr:trigger factor [Bacteroidota bacterium]
MNISSENLGPLHLRLTIEIDPADYKPKFDKSIKDLGKKATIKGFRPGHVPISMVKKLYGDQALADELNRLVNEQISNYVKESNIEILGDPLPTEDERVEIDYNSDKPYTFKYELGIQPELNVSEVFKGAAAFKRYRIPAKLEEIEAEVGRILKRLGTQEEVESAMEGDVVYVHLQEVKSDGTPIENGIDTDSYFNLEMLTESGVELFNGIEKDAVKNIPDLFAVFNGEKTNVAKNILQMKEEDLGKLDSMSPSFECKVEKIVRLKPAELNAEVFENLSKEYGPVSNEEELQNKIKDIIESYNDRMTETALENDIYKYLTDTTEVPLPEVFLQKWFRATMEKELDEMSFEEQFNTFKTRLKQSLIFQKVRKENSLEATKEEIIEETMMQVRSTYGSMGEELVNYIVQNNLNDKTFVENMHDRVMQQKFFEILKGYITTIDEMTTLEEYQNLNKEVTYAE